MNRGALSLLSEYGGDSSDDDVPSGRVSTKRTFKNEDKTDQKSKKLCVPSALLPSKENHNDNPNLHDGRIRSFPHERDSWATFVYIPYEINDGIRHVINSINHFLPEFKVVSDFHISLTKVVVLRYHWIDSFVDTVKNSMKNIGSFLVMFDTLEVYCNEDRTRTFIGFQVKTGYDTLLKLTSTLDKCLEEFKLPKFYEDCKFHMSIAWCVGDLEDDVRKLLSALNEQLPYIFTSYSEDNWYIIVNTLLCKIGNKYFTFCLS